MVASVESAPAISEQPPKLNKPGQLNLNQLKDAVRSGPPKGPRPETQKFYQQVEELKDGEIERLKPKTKKDGKRKEAELKAKRKQEEKKLLDSQIKQLREKGYTGVKMAQELKTPVSRIDRRVHRLIRAGEIESYPHKRKCREEQIKQLRNAGMSNQEIGEELGIKKTIVSHIAENLIRKKEIKPQRVRLTKEGIKNFDSQVKELKEKRLTVRKIAERLGEEDQDPIKVMYRVTNSLWRLKQAERTKVGQPISQNPQIP